MLIGGAKQLASLQLVWAKLYILQQETHIGITFP